MNKNQRRLPPDWSTTDTGRRDNNDGKQVCFQCRIPNCPRHRNNRLSHKIRIPRRSNRREWKKLEILYHENFLNDYHGYSPDIGYKAFNGFTGEQDSRKPRPQALSELEQFLIRNYVIENHREYRNLIKNPRKKYKK